MDNSSNERPDWFEYHPIRKFLLEQKLEGDAHYGFFSPKFGSKTTLSSDKVKNFITANEGADAILFCPFFDQSAFFLNVFEQGEINHPGLLQVSQEFVDAVGVDVNLKDLVTDSANTIFANYFVARSKFWTEWFHLAEQLYTRAEELRSSLVAATPHRGTHTIHHKVFLMERLATLLFATNDIYRTAIYDPTELPVHTHFVPFVRQAVVCDALKLAYRRFKNRKYLDEFFALRNSVFEMAYKSSGNQISQNQNLPGHNEACPCGSGKKYKHCHGRL